MIALHFPLPSMNRLNQNEPATFAIFWGFLQGFFFSCILITFWYLLKIYHSIITGILESEVNYLKLYCLSCRLLCCWSFCMSCYSLFRHLSYYVTCCLSRHLPGCLSSYLPSLLPRCLSWCLSFYFSLGPVVCSCCLCMGFPARPFGQCIHVLEVTFWERYSILLCSSSMFDFFIHLKFTYFVWSLEKNNVCSLPRYSAKSYVCEPIRNTIPF